MASNSNSDANSNTSNLPSHMPALVKIGTDKVKLARVAVPTPGPGEVLVRVYAAAQNPSEWMKLKKGWPEASEGLHLVVGHDFAGIIVQLGPDVSIRAKIGQRVAGFIDGCSYPLPTGGNGTFAPYCLADPLLLIDIPDNLAFEDAATLGMAGFTACQALWQQQVPIQPRLPTPLEPLVPERKEAFPILIWSGATSVGQYAIQLAKMSGMYPVITTASPSNHQLLNDLGADAVFDYRDEEVVRKVQEVVRNNHTVSARGNVTAKLIYAMDCASTPESIARVAECLDSDSDSNTAGEGALETSQSAYIAKVLVVQIPDDTQRKLKTKIESDFTFVYTLFGKPTIGHYDYPAIPAHYEYGQRYAKILSMLLAQGQLRTTPVKLISKPGAESQDGDGEGEGEPYGALGRLSDADWRYWIDYQEQGKVRGEKIVYSFVD